MSEFSSRATVLGHEEVRADHPGATSSDRSFGLVLGIALAIVGLWPARTPAFRWWWIGAAALVSLVALAAPRLLGPVHRGAFRVAILMSRVTTPLVMGLLFYGLFTPLGFWMRRSGSGSSSFRRLPRGAQESYWTPCPRAAAGPGMERPF